eukprot:5419372-Pyramimonas_sp.AAC.1
MVNNPLRTVAVPDDAALRRLAASLQMDIKAGGFIVFGRRNAEFALPVAYRLVENECCADIHEL